MNIQVSNIKSCGVLQRNQRILHGLVAVMVGVQLAPLVLRETLSVNARTDQQLHIKPHTFPR